jgi:Planctomycete cytochrome C/WD domain, G-beta repeat
MITRPRALVGAAAAVFAAAFIAACAPRTTRVHGTQPSVRVAYSDVQAIFDDSCEHCHNEDKIKGGLLVESYDELVAGGDHGAAILPGDSGGSRLVQMVEGRLKPRMPYKEDALSASQIEVIRRWIDQGAPAPPPTDGTASPPEHETALPDIKPAVQVNGAVAAIAFDPSTRRIAVGSYQSVHLMSLPDRKWIATLAGHADLVRAIAFSPDGNWLAIAGGPSGRFGEIKVWDVHQPKPKLLSTIHGHRDTILAIAFSPDGKSIASASYDKLVKVWDVNTGKQLKSLKEHSDAVYAVAFMPDGKRLVSAAGDRTLKVWDVAAGTRLTTINDALDSLYAVAVNPSGTQIAAAGADRIVRTWAWNEASESNPATLQASTFAHADAVLRLAYSSDGSTLVSAGADRAVKVWDAKTLRERQLFDGQPDWVMALALSADGKWLAAGRYDGTLGLYGFNGDGSREEFVVPREK